MTTVVLLVCLFALLSSNAAFAEGKSSQKRHEIKRHVKALEQQWRKAQLEANLPIMEKMLADDYIGITMSGQVNTKAQQLDRIRTGKLVLTRFDLNEIKVKLVGSVAIVTCTAEVEGTSEMGLLRGPYQYTRIYQLRSNGEWKITSLRGNTSIFHEAVASGKQILSPYPMQASKP